MLEDLNERLARKAYENARLYYKREDYKASRVAFKNVRKDNVDNIYREDILYYAAMTSYNYALNSVPAKQKERYMVFMDDYLNFVGEYPDSKYRRELDRLYEKVKKKYIETFFSSRIVKTVEKQTEYKNGYQESTYKHHYP